MGRWGGGGGGRVSGKAAERGVGGGSRQECHRKQSSSRALPSMSS